MPFSDNSLAFLRKLLDTPGPSGFEGAPARLWREEAAKFAEVSADVAGNSAARVCPAGKPRIMLAGHIDEVGVIVTHVDDEGYVYVAPIGGWDIQVLIGQRLRFLGRHGDVIGLVGKKPIHLIKQDEREKSPKWHDIWVDIGARTRAEVEERLSVGDAGVIDSRTVEMPNGLIASRSIDDRIGAFIVLEALRRYAAEPGSACVLAVATTQEEIAWRGGGAAVGAFRAEPQMAIVVDVTFATDHPGADKREIGEHRIGGGPVITRGSVISPVVSDLLRETAVMEGIPFTLHAAGRDTATDADAIHVARDGIATGLLSIPNRYMHSPNELVAIEDLDRAVQLIAAVCRRVSSSTDFTAR